MYVVTITHNYSPNSEAVLFQNHDRAFNFMKNKWEEMYDIEVDEFSSLDYENCYVSDPDDFGIITWLCGCYTVFRVIEAKMIP